MMRHVWYFFLVALAGWMNRQQQDVIEYLREENRILREKLGGRRILLSVAQKRRLATAAARLGRSLLKDCATLFSPDTLLRWHRWYVAQKYDGSGKRGPKAKKANQIRNLVLRKKAQSQDWGYGHIHGELLKLGFDVSWQTVRRIMIEHGLIDDVRRVVHLYAEEYYNRERPHQGLGNRTILPPAQPPPTKGRILCRQWLGGVLKSYYRKAA